MDERQENLKKTNEKPIPNNSLGSTYIPFPYSFAIKILNENNVEKSNNK